MRAFLWKGMKSCTESSLSVKKFVPAFKPGKELKKATEKEIK